MINAIVYVSQATQRFSENELLDLAQSAADRNAANGITGYLFFHRERFLQYIEGAPLPLERLMESISCDARHRVMASARDEPFDQRRFPRWHMRWLERPDLVEIQMEHLLADQLLLEHDYGRHHSTAWSASVWRMANTLARLQGRKT